MSIHGYLGFSDAMDSLPLPPLKFPVPTWPADKDPSFIGPFYSRCRMGHYKENDVDKRRPGVYFRSFSLANYVIFPTMFCVLILL